jgi:hypothetical protein
MTGGYVTEQPTAAIPKVHSAREYLGRHVHKLNGCFKMAMPGGFIAYENTDSRKLTSR